MIICKKCGNEAPAVEAGIYIFDFGEWDQVSDKVGFCCNTIYMYKPSEFLWGLPTEIAIEVPNERLEKA